MKKKLYKTLVYLILLFMGVYLVWYCFKDITMSDFLTSLKEVNISILVLSMLIGAVPYFVRALRWKMLIQAVDHNPSTKNVYNALMLGFVTNLILPRVGEVSRCASLTKMERIPFDKLIGTVVIERSIDMLCLLFTVFLAFIFRMDFLVSFINENIIIPMSGKALSFSSLFSLFLILLSLSLLTMLSWKLISSTLKNKIKSLLLGIVTGIKSIFALNNYGLFLLYTLIIWVCFWLTSYIALLSIPSTSVLGPSDALFLMVLGSLAWLIPLPGGMGSFHFSVAFGLQLYGLTKEQGVVFATISHESQLVVTILLGIVSLISVARFRKSTARFSKTSLKE